MRPLTYLLIACAFGTSSLRAQMPPGWISEQSLGQDMESGQTWFGAGCWAAEQHGAPATQVQSLGYGNALTGAGFMLEAGTKTSSWDLAAQVLLYRDPDQASRASIQQGHALYHSEGGWVAGVEKEPLVWGYGLNGGYLLGEASRPVPKVRVQSPYRDFSLFGVPLGTWSGQCFLGKLESRREVGEDYQSTSWAQKEIHQSGEPQGPLLSGFRAEARFGETTEFYFNWLVEWGGSLNGLPMTQGYSPWDYVTAFTGIKDILAESSWDPRTSYDTGNVQYANKARSSTNSDVGVRVKVYPLERLLGASDARFYISRGSKGAGWPYSVTPHKPLYYLAKDLKYVVTPSHGWNSTVYYYVPAPKAPNDCVGLLLSWPKVRLGVEYLDTVNDLTADGGIDTYRSFYNGVYKTGFYYQGDPLGSGLGGEARYGTVRLEWDVSERLSLQTWLQHGCRPFRDDAKDWQLDHPGQTSGAVDFTGLQQVVRWKITPSLALHGGYSWQHQTNQGYVQGETGNGFRWFAQLAWHWLK